MKNKLTKFYKKHQDVVNRVAVIGGCIAGTMIYTHIKLDGMKVVQVNTHYDAQDKVVGTSVLLKNGTLKPFFKKAPTT